MDRFLAISAGEASEVAPVVAAFSQGAKFPITLNYLYQRWTDFVIEVERGYGASIYDYTNDLSVRDLLAEILRQVGASTREKLAAQLQPWDSRFDEATTAKIRPLLASKTATSAPWWGRIPRNPTGELAEDLRAEGLVE
jgi:hypothetical protein